MARLGLNKDFEPFGDYVLIKHIPRAQTDGGIALPEGAEGELPIGRVIRTGPGNIAADTGVQMPMPCKEGDLVYFNSPRHREAIGVELDHEDYYVIRAVDILGRLTVVQSSVLSS